MPPVNAETNSAFIDHLLRYPVVVDSVNGVKDNKFGQKGLALSSSAYQTFARPIVPYLAKPYQYVSPYVQKLDQLGDKSLSQVDERLPVVKKPTGELVEDTKSLALLPYRKGQEGKEHIFSVYNSELKQLGGQQTLFNAGKALVGTAIIVTAETVTWLRELLGAKKAQVQGQVQKAIN